MTLIKSKDIIQEIVMFLRNNLVDSKSRGTAATQSYTATAGQTAFVITTNYPLNITGVTKNAVAVAFGSGYTFNYDTKTMTLTTGATINDVIIISYKYGTDSWVDFKSPRLDLNLDDYPRISVSSIARTNNVLGLNQDGMGTSFSFRIKIFMDNRNDVMDMVDTIRQLMWSARRSFYYFNALTPTADAGPGIDSVRKNEIYIADIDFSIPIQAQD